MSNRFTTYTVDLMITDGWMRPEEASALRIENERLKGDVEAEKHSHRGTTDFWELALKERDEARTDLAHQKQLLVERDRVLGVARDRLEGILQVCEFIDDEEQHQTKATQSALDQINKVLEVPK